MALAARSPHRDSRFASILVLLSVLALAPTTASADPHETGDVLSASPDAPATGLGWRGYLRGTIAPTLPLLRPRDGSFRFEILPLVELHNVRGDAFPNHLWRGRLALAATLRAPHGLAASLLLEHESDHRTASGATPLTGFLVLNDLGVRVSWLAPLPTITLLVRGTARGYFLTCTTDHIDCAQNLGLDGSLGVGGALEAIVDATSPGTSGEGLRPFAALLLEALAAGDRIRGEARAVLNLGATLSSSRTGRWQLFAIGWLGNDVGFRRERTVRHVGLALRWSWG